MENKEIIKNLQSTDKATILNTLKYISTEGNKDILSHVIKLLNSNSDSGIREEVINILENLKNQDCAEIIIQNIHNKDLNKELPILVSSCWKNSLNFEDYIEIFTDIFIESEFITAFDAFTVIDNFENVNIASADSCLIKLTNNIENATNDKKALFSELITKIENLKENPAD